MSKSELNPAPAAIIMILLGAAARLVPHPANFAPIAALALFGGAHLPRPYGQLIPLAAMFASDAILGFDFASLPYVYGVFLVTSFIGVWLRGRTAVGHLVVASLSSSILFYLVTNLVWIYPVSLYPHTLAGQIESYLAALPFFRNTLLGDLFFTGVFFGGYALARSSAGRLLPARLVARIF